MRDPAQESVLSTGQTASKLWSRKAQHEETAWRAMHAFQRVGQRHKRGFSVIEHNLLPALADQKGALRIHDEADVIGRIGIDARPPVARALHLAGHQLQAGKRLYGEVDLHRVVVHWLGIVA